MNSSQALAALTAKKVELAAKRDEALRLAERLRGDIQALDRAITVLDPAYKPAADERVAGRRPRLSIFGHGELRRLVLETIQGSDGAITAHGVAERIAGIKNVAADDANMRKAIEARVASTLSALKGQGVLAGGKHGHDGRSTYSLAA